MSSLFTSDMSTSLLKIFQSRADSSPFMRFANRAARQRLIILIILHAHQSVKVCLQSYHSAGVGVLITNHTTSSNHVFRKVRMPKFFERNPNRCWCVISRKYGQTFKISTGFFQSKSKAEQTLMNQVQFVYLRWIVVCCRASGKSGWTIEATDSKITDSFPSNQEFGY